MTEPDNDPATTPSLAGLQQDFLRYLQYEQRDIEPVILSTERVSADLRLRIYANAYWSRLSEALQENFPALHTLLGDDDFHELAESYIRRYPSQHFSLRYFGDRLTELLQQPPYAGQSVLAEMARFEWAVWAAFDAADVVPATLEDIQSVPPEQWGDLVFELHPSCQLLELKWNVPVLWQAMADEAEPIAPEQGEATNWLIWRQGLGTYFRTAEADEAWALSRLQQGSSFAALCEGLGEWVGVDHAVTRVVGFLQTWLNDGVVCLCEC
ncbi:MAG: DNA-binding domain-containing protein [Thiolinea sp.]